MNINQEKWIDIATRLHEVQEQIKDLQCVEANLLDALKLEQQEVELVELGRFSFYQISRKGSINYKSIVELANVDLEKNRGNPVKYWKFSKS
jgi:hypothetical protein